MVPSVCEVTFQGIDEDSMSWKVLGVVDIQSPSACQGCPPKTLYRIRRKEHLNLSTLISSPNRKHHRLSIHSIYVLIMDSLEHISIANVPAQGPTSSVFMVPRAS